MMCGARVVCCWQQPNLFLFPYSAGSLKIRNSVACKTVVTGACYLNMCVKVTRYSEEWSTH
jgi:hypothetical protein